MSISNPKTKSLKINLKRLTKRFLKLVKIESPSKKEGKISRNLILELKSLGLKVYQDKAGKYIEGECGNIIAYLKGTLSSAPTLLLNAHLDTVQTPRVRPRVKKGIIYSDGTTILGADNKAGIAIILEALQVLKERKIPHGDLQVVFTVAEEIGLLGARNIDWHKLKADFGCTLDGGAVDAVLIKAPSQKSIFAEVFGKAAHAGVHPEEGINAIAVTSRAIANMKLGRIDKETTANIGIIQGGLATNIIPERCEIKGEVRSHNHLKLRRQLEHMEAALERACHKFKARLKLKVEPTYNSFNLDKKSKPVCLALRAAERAGFKPLLKATGGGSDANIFNAYGIPMVILGTGAQRVHTTSERIAIEDMKRAAEFLVTIVEESCGKK